MSDSRRSEWLIVIFIVLLVIVLRMPTIHQPFENDSGSFAYHARLIARGEPLYGTHHSAHHMPGTHYVYAAAFLMFGDRVESVRLMLLIWTAVAVFLLYRLGSVVANKRVGLLAAVFAAILFSHINLAGTNTRNESFLVLPQIAAVLILMHLARGGGKTWHFFFVGLFGGITMLMKANYISPLFLAAAVLVVSLWPQWRDGAAWRHTIGKGLWITGGWLAAVVPVVLYYAAIGLSDRFWLIFTIGVSYTQVTLPASPSPLYPLLFPLAVLAANNGVLLFSSLAGLAFVLLANVPRRHVNAAGDGRPSSMPMLFIALWFLFSFVETGVSQIFLLNYYLVFVAPLSLLAAWFMFRLYKDVQLRLAPRWRRMAVLIPILLVAAALFISARQHFPYYYHFYARYLPGRESYFEVLQAGLPEGVAETMQAMEEVAQYMRTRTTAEDTIYYWSNFMELYYLMDRRAAADVIWPLNVDKTGPPQRILAADYILLGDTPLGYSTELPEWLAAGLAEDFVLETELYDQQIYRRTGE